MTRLCTEFRNNSDYIYNWFESKRNVKEESFTDWMLYNLSQKLANFNYREYTRHEENAISGADFDFWLIENSNYLVFRIQAKKLKRTGNHFNAITYPNQTSDQIDLLISSSNLPIRPFYLFYNNDTYNSRCDRHNTGTLLASAQEIQNTLLTGSNTSISRQQLTNLCIPLECLFCCPLSSHLENKLQGISEVVRQYFPTSKIDGYQSDGLPDYVRDALNKEISNERWTELYGQINENKVRYIAVIDLKYNEK
ncbi:MAG: DUF6615 family protein [Saprospiraceae bacterium]